MAVHAQLRTLPMLTYALGMWRAIILFGVFLAASRAQAEPSNVRSFLSRLIAYETSGRADLRSQAFLSMLTRRLRTAVLADMAGSDIAVIDADPICQCQDDDGLRMRLVDLKVKGAAAEAEVVSNSGSRDARRVRLKMARTGSDWRIADVASRNVPSLLAALERNNRIGR